MVRNRDIAESTCGMYDETRQFLHLFRPMRCMLAYVGEDLLLERAIKAEKD
jgi:hypothetical protein